MNEKTQLTFIVPVKNMEKYIEKCIDSILNQTTKFIEIIIVDFGSTDETPQIIKKNSDNRIVLIENKDITDVCQARNFGIQLAKGRYISFIDADDWISTEFADKAIMKLEETNSDICIMNYNNIDEITGNEEKIKISIKQEVEINKNNVNDILTNVAIGNINCEAWNKVYKTEFLRINDIRFNNKYGVNGEDLLFNNICYMNMPKLVYIDCYLYNHLLRKKSLGKINNINVSRRFRYIIENTENFRKQKKLNIDNAIAILFLSLMIQLVYSKKKFKEKNKALKEMLKNDKSMLYIKLCKKIKETTNKRRIICNLLEMKLNYIFLLLTYL